MVKTTIPGVKAAHAIISDDCRRGGDEFNRACDKLRPLYDQLCEGWGIGKGAKMNIVITIERPGRDQVGEQTKTVQPHPPPGGHDEALSSGDCPNSQRMA